MLKKILVLSAALFLIFTAAVSAQEAGLFDTAPNITLKDLKGNSVAVKDFRGKVVVLVFWAAGCDECMKQLRKVKTHIGKKRYKDVQFVFVSKIDKDADRDKAQKEIDGEKLRSVLLMDNDMAMVKAFGVQMVPSFFLIDRKGRVNTSGVILPDEKLRTKTFLELIDMVEGDKRIAACEFGPSDKGNPYLGLEGRPCPDVSAVDASGKKQANYFYKGFSRLLIIYWMPTCPHCRREIPRIEKLYEADHDKRNFEILSIVPSNDEKIKQLAIDFAKANKITFPIAFDETGKASEALGVKSFPSLFLLDRSGRVYKTFEGEFFFTEEVLRCFLDEMPMS